MSDTTNLDAALVAANTDLTNPRKQSTAKAGTYSYTYADLASILDHVRPVLAAHGLAVTQDVVMAEGRVQVFTLIHHVSGETRTYGPLVGRAGDSWQQLGSAITYARRYALTAALGIAGDDDTDAQDVPVKPAQRTHSPAPADDPWYRTTGHDEPDGPDVIDLETDQGREQLRTLVGEAQREYGTHKGPSGRNYPNGQDKASARQLHALERLATKHVGTTLAEYLTDDTAHLILGEQVTADALTKVQASALIKAFQAFETEAQA